MKVERKKKEKKRKKVKITGYNDPTKADCKTSMSKVSMLKTSLFQECEHQPKLKPYYLINPKYTYRQSLVKKPSSTYLCCVFRPAVFNLFC